MPNLSPFDDAREQVKRWLDGDGSAYARRVHTGADSHRLSWEVDLQGGHPAVERFRITLPREFPAAPCEIFVEPQLCLKLPHVEESGRVCLNSGAPPRAYEDAASTVRDALERFSRDFLERITTVGWAEGEFQEERLSYWARHCDKARGQAPPAPRETWLALNDLGLLRSQGWVEGEVAAYVRPGSARRRYGLQLVSTGDVDPNALAQRHGWARGTSVRGHALVVQLPDGSPWTPSTWPADFDALSRLVQVCTGTENLLENWVARIGWAMSGAKRMERHTSWRRKELVDEPPLGYAPRSVILVDSGAAYGFQLNPPSFQAMSAVVTPITVSRVDRTWALVRDHGIDVLDARFGKRVALIGCGSLGSPTAELLARSGIGHLDLVDGEVFDSPNVGRHALGLPSLQKAKATDLAARLQELVPGCSVRGFQMTAANWLTRTFRSDDYDLVIDCTGESSVRTLLAALRPSMFPECLVVHAWVEPFCSAAHVVVSTPEVPWPVDDPADALVNAADFGPDGGRVPLPACSGGFHRYGAADVAQAGAFASERIIGLLDEPNAVPMVYSWVRSQGFFDALGVPVATREVVPPGGSKYTSTMLERSLSALLAR